MIPGYKVRTTPDSGIRVIELDYWADPAKTPEWAAEARRRYPSPRKWRQEMERDWSAAAGDAYYYEWLDNGGNGTYVHRAPGIIPGLPIERGWDFGIRGGAVTFSQYSPQSRRWWTLRELLLVGPSTYVLRDVTLYLSGQIAFDNLNSHAQDVIRRIEDDPRYPKPPWFRQHGAQPLEFRDWSGHEANQPRAEVAEESEGRTSAQILAAAGIYLSQHYGAIKGSGQILRDLLRVRADGYPGFLIDPACPILIKGLGGRITFAEGTKENPRPEKPKKDGYYEHPHEALLYSMASVVPAADQMPREQQGETVIVDRQAVVLPPEGASFDLYETSSQE